MSKLTLERRQLSQLQRNPAEYRAVNAGLMALEAACFYTLNPQYRFQIRHDQDGDYFAFFRYLAGGRADRVFTLLFRNRARVLVGCCQIVLQERNGGIYAYFCDLKVAPAYRRRALKQLAAYLLRDSFFNRRDSLLEHYCRLQGDVPADLKLYFVNMGGQDFGRNGLVRICRRFARLFVWLARLSGRKVSLHVHIRRGYVAAANTADLNGTVAAEKKIILCNRDSARIKELDLHHAPMGSIADDPEVDYARTVVMALSDTPTQQPFTLFYTHKDGGDIPMTDFLRHSGMI